MENYSKLMSNDFVVVYQDNDGVSTFNEYHFKFFGSKHYAQIELKNNKYSVVFDRDIFEFDNLEDSICFSLGGSFVDSYQQEGYEQKINDLLDTNLITKKQHDQMMKGGKKLVNIWWEF